MLARSARWKQQLYSMHRNRCLASRESLGDGPTGAGGNAFMHAACMLAWHDALGVGKRVHDSTWHGGCNNKREKRRLLQEDGRTPRAPNHTVHFNPAGEMHCNRSSHTHSS